MNITPEISYIQNAILLAVHNTQSITYARKKESKMKDCMYITKKLKRYFNEYWIPEEEIIIWENWMYAKWKAIGLPPCLSRVLFVLGSNYGYWLTGIVEIDDYDNDIGTQYNLWDTICERKLLNEDWQSATLFDQSEETISKIALLLGYNEK